MWLVARTEARKEFWALANIENQGHVAYIPKYREHYTASGKLRKLPADKVLFPGYIFCYTTGPWVFLTGTRGITKLLMVGDKPGIVSDDLIRALKSQEDKDGYVSLPSKNNAHSAFSKGDTVRLRSGPFLSYIGVYDGRTSSEYERVLLEYFGRKTVIQVHLDDIERAE